MKILMFALEYPPLLGGGGTYVDNLCRHLSKFGEQIKLVTSGETDSTQTISDNFVIVRSSNLLDLYKQKGNPLIALDLLLNEIEEFQPDLVHTHHSLEKILFSMVNVTLHLPHISTHHKTPEFEGYQRTKSGKRIQFIFSNTLNTDKYISLSNVFKQDLISTGVNKELIEVIYPGINNDRYYPLDRDSPELNNLKQKLALKADDILIFIPIVIRPRKGVEFTLAAISKLSIKGRNIKIVISGLSEFENNPATLDYYSKLAQPHILLRTSSLTSQNMNELYNLASVVAFGSQGEGLGSVVLESLACKCPIVTTNVNGIKEIIINQINGLISEYGDTQSFSDNLKLVLTNENVKNTIINGGLNSLNTIFNSQLMTEKHLKVYQEVIANHKN